MKMSFRQVVPFVLICVLTARTISAQQPPPLSKKASEVKVKVETLSPQARVSVIPVHGEEEFGTFVSNDPDRFTFYDVDQKMNVTLKYEEVRKVKDGYGGYNHLRGRHTDHTKAIVIGVVLACVLVALIIAAAHSN
jgi:hypothetical protein